MEIDPFWILDCGLRIADSGISKAEGLMTENDPKKLTDSIRELIRI
jgi:hypothetical protein